MPELHTIRSGNQNLKCGYTTGTCAALAAGGAAYLLLTRSVPEVLSILTPKGWEVAVTPDTCEMQADSAVCSVIKDAGDDPDATDGMAVFASVSYAEEPGITIDGGEGVGRVTRPGLDQPVGAAAINHVPRSMIRDQVEAVCQEAGYSGGLNVIISIPGGEEKAKHTFNPKLGIEGGLSVLGTSGIVEPMSQQALLDTLHLEIRQAAAEGAKNLILTPGNYGQDYLQSVGLDSLGVPVIKCSNFIGDALDMAAAEHFQAVLLVGHIGKLIKVAGGIMNTHSSVADCRMEVLTAYAARHGASPELCQELLQAATTNAGLDLLQDPELRDAVFQDLADATQKHLEYRVKDAYPIGAIVFSNETGELYQTSTAEPLIRAFRRNEP